MFSSNVEDAISIQKKRLERENQIKIEIFNILTKKIQNYSKLGKLYFIFQIPNFLIGHAPYNIIDINKYLINKLKKDGFYIQKINEEYIFISWDIKQLGKKENKNTETINYSAFKNNFKSK